MVQGEGLRDRGAQRKPTCGNAARFFWERSVPLPQWDEAHARRIAASRSRDAYLLLQTSHEQGDLHKAKESGDFLTQDLNSTKSLSFALP